MHQITYDHRFDYRYLPDHTGLYPVLELQLSHGNAYTSFPAVIDTGALLSLVSGEHAQLLGISLSEGVKIKLYTLSGVILAWSHSVHVQVADLEFDKDLCFSEFRLPRNIMGRDLLDYLNIGLLERYSTLYVSRAE